MKSSLLINPALKEYIDSYIANPAQALLLYGKRNHGKAALATEVANVIKDSKAYSTVVTVVPLEDKSTIGIGQIKDLKKSLRSKNKSYRIIVIPDADILTIEAQNNFLKLLEEPPANVLFILTTSNKQALLATIRSRLLKLRYIAPTQEQMHEYASKLTNEPVDKYILIADGRVPLLNALLSSNKDNSVMQNIDKAKDILSEPVAERLIRVDAIAKNNRDTQDILDSLMLTCNAALTNSIQNNRQHKRWLQRIKAIETAYNQLAKNISVKLVLCRLFLVL